MFFWNHSNINLWLKFKYIPFAYSVISIIRHSYSQTMFYHYVCIVECNPKYVSVWKRSRMVIIIQKKVGHQTMVIIIQCEQLRRTNIWQSLVHELLHDSTTGLLLFTIFLSSFLSPRFFPNVMQFIFFFLPLLPIACL